MRVLFTGGSSKLGGAVLERLLGSPEISEAWCAVHRSKVLAASPKVRLFPWDTTPAPSVDLLVHFAGLTHSPADGAYWDVNLKGTRRLVDQARAAGCRRMVYISTRCAARGSGAYGESKKAAEDYVLSLSWESLLIVRPAEVYGAASREGVDRFIALARKFHAVPLLFGHPGLRFAPIHARDFTAVCAELILSHRSGVKTVELCGPEALSGAGLALRIARRHRALPIPVWWPALSAAARLAAAVGLPFLASDQLTRTVGPKSAQESSLDPALSGEMTLFPED